VNYHTEFSSNFCMKLFRNWQLLIQIYFYKFFILRIFIPLLPLTTNFHREIQCLFRHVFTLTNSRKSTYIKNSIRLLINTYLDITRDTTVFILTGIL
jgi:hypothetical protein